MALLLTSHPPYSSLFLKNATTTATTKLHFYPFKPSTFSFSALPYSPKLTIRTPFSPLRFSASNFSGDLPDSPFSKPPTSQPPENEDASDNSPAPPATSFTDEWGEKTEPETEPSTKFSGSDPPKDEDEWGGLGVQEEYVFSGNGNASSDVDDKLWELKRCFVDTVYDTDFGFRASSEVRADASELVNKLEATNPTPAPTEAAALDGNWVLLYTAFSELLPLLAAGTLPLLKVERICQAINTRSLTIENSVTFSSPVATSSFSASANFEIRTPSRIQVEFKEGILNPPEIKSSIDLPENVDIFGQNINLLPLQQSLNPLQDAVASIARTVSGQSPLKIPIPGERTKSWLIITYLDKDFLISRGDGGLFVLAKAGSSLLDQ